MDFLYFLEGIRTPFLNEAMLAITQLGDELMVLLVAVITFWCADKKTGYYILSVGLLGTVASQFLKLWCRVPRPWVMDKNFTIVEEAREAASGYSFPSGHSQIAVGTYGSIAYTTKNRVLRYLGITAAVLVPFTRMYLGVHTFWDVIASVILSLALIFALKPLILSEKQNTFPVFLCFMLVIAIGFLCFVSFYPFPADVDIHNLNSGIKNAYTFLGCVLGLLVVYFVESRWIHYPTKAVWWAQVIKVVAGMLVVLIVKEGLRDVMATLFGQWIGRAVRYFLVVVVAGTVWPLTFKWFAKLGVKE